MTDAITSTTPTWKQVATLQARAALLGIELRAMPGGGYVAAADGAICALPDVDAVEAYLAGRQDAEGTTS